jgi:hypothetical protein
MPRLCPSVLSSEEGHQATYICSEMVDDSSSVSIKMRSWLGPLLLFTAVCEAPAECDTAVEFVDCSQQGITAIPTIINKKVKTV